MHVHGLWHKGVMSASSNVVLCYYCSYSVVGVHNTVFFYNSSMCLELDTKEKACLSELN
jgi:hypothetical protein